MSRRHALLLALALGACAAPESELGLEPTTRPTVYHALSGPEIRARMQALADELTTLVLLTQTPSSEHVADAAARREDVVTSLDHLERQAKRVGGNGAVTNYSAVNDYMDGFLADVTLAREFAEREPANLVPANRLVNSCRACHGSI